MTNIVIPDFQAGYTTMCRTVLDAGVEVAPRGKKTRELTDVRVEILNPRISTPVGTGRRVPPKIIAAETTQFLAGISDLAQLDAVSGGNFSQFSDNGIQLYGAYGPRIRGQVPGVVSRLLADKDSRQACITVWRDSDAVAITKDLPCTMGFMFTLRDDKLNMTTTMRSSDAWLGMAIDVPVFIRLQMAIAQLLDVELGSYVHNSRSLHLYEQDWYKVEELYQTPVEVAEQPPWFPIPSGISPTQMQDHAASIVLDPSSHANWYADRLKASRNKLCHQCHYVVPDLDDHTCVA